MLDLYIKRIIIHQFSPNDTELVLAEGPLEITPRLDEYFRKKLSKVFSDEAKRGYFDAENVFISHLGDDLMESSVKIAQLWKEEFVISEDQKTNDLVFIQFDKEGQEYFAFLRIALKDSLIHSLGDSQHPIQLSQNNLPSAAQTPDEALVINRSSKQYYLIEKRIKHNGSFANYFSENLLQVQPEQSVKKSIKMVEDTAQKIAENFNQDDFNFQGKMKSAIFNNLEEDQELSPEKLADQLFDNNLTARLTFVDELKEAIPEPISVSDIDHSRQIKKLENQKLSLSNGIELIVPNNVYQDADSVEFIQNPDGTYSVLIIGIQCYRIHANIQHVLTYESMVKEVLAEDDIDNTTNVDLVLAMIYTETKGKTDDVMQSSESSTGVTNSITDRKESIRQGVTVLSENLEEAAHHKVDPWTAVQAYNFGKAYIDYVADNGGVNTVELAKAYSKNVVAPSLGNTSGKTYTYYQPVAMYYGGGKLYTNGGNIYYAKEVQFNLFLMRMFSRL